VTYVSFLFNISRFRWSSVTKHAFSDCLILSIKETQLSFYTFFTKQS
jgi:hypothetical protein